MVLRAARALVLATCVLSIALIASVAAAAPALRVEVTQRGDFVLLGNTLGHECAAGTPVPVVGTVGACGTNTADSGIDVLWRADAPGFGQAQASTAITVAQARSTAVLTLPAGATVTHAFVYWAATAATATADATATLDRPGGFTSALIALQSWNGANNTYQSMADVTALVQANGVGAYRMGGVDVVTVTDRNDSNTFAGWWMVVLYERASDPLRTLSIFDGLDVVSSGSPQNITLSGFLVPSAGFTGRLGIATFEGDNTLTGDQVFFNGGAALTNAQNPATNFFNGTRSTLGAPVSVVGDLPQLTGAAQSMSGLDLDVVDVTSRLTAGATSASVSATSTGDVYHLSGFVTAIDTFAAELGTSTKTATDLDGGDVLPGDQVEYTLTASNTGNDPATQTVLTDALPLGVTFVPGSLAVVTGANAGTKTDAAGDDQAEYVSASRTVRFHLGTGADGTTGGQLAIGATTTVRFRVTIDAGTLGTLSNQGTLTAIGAVGGRLATSSTDGDTTLAGAQPTNVVVEACSTDAQCTAPTSRCDTAPTPNACVQCIAQSDCSGLTPTCVASTCVCVPTGLEICDGVDNDCNGSVDEGYSLGSACSAGVGGCEATGVVVCDAVGSSSCSATAGAPAAELCNGVDDDCDGTVDNGDPGGGVACSSGLPGACAPGVTACVASALTCGPTVTPGAVAETCNATDDDCDGVVDDGFDLGTECSAGVGACLVVGVVACDGAGAAMCDAVPEAPVTEVCDDGIDDDCDGVVDDGCVPDAGMPDAGTMDLPDAGASDAGPDASSSDASIAGGDAGEGVDGGTAPGVVGGGCGCRTAGRGDAGPASMALVALGLTLLARRRRR